MQKHFQQSTRKIIIYLDDAALEVDEGITVAAAVLAAHARYTRSTEKKNCKRSPYCQMGICFECLMNIDGMENQQACMIEVRAGMRIVRQNGISDFTAAP